jgi:uncharacterized protein YggU (UPF0235/DUF167 family)
MKISVTVKPNSNKGPLVELQPDGSYLIYVREIASGSQANEALIKTLAKYFSIPKSNLKIVRGLSSRHKLIERL